MCRGGAYAQLSHTAVTVRSVSRFVSAERFTEHDPFMFRQRVSLMRVSGLAIRLTRARPLAGEHSVSPDRESRRQIVPLTGTRNTITIGDRTFDKITLPTTQGRASQLLGAPIPLTLT
jgi:hypothetical protein